LLIGRDAPDLVGGQGRALMAGSLFHGVEPVDLLLKALAVVGRGFIGRALGVAQESGRAHPRGSLQKRHHGLIRAVGATISHTEDAEHGQQHPAAAA